MLAAILGVQNTCTIDPLSLTNHGWVGRQHGAAVRPARQRLPAQRRSSVMAWRLARSLALPVQSQRAATNPLSPLLLLPPCRRAAAARLHVLRQQRQVAISLLILAVLTFVLAIYCSAVGGNSRA